MEHLYKLCYKVTKRGVGIMKYRIYTEISTDQDKLYLGINGNDLIIDAVDETDAIKKSVNWVYTTSRYSLEKTTDWLSLNKLYCEKVEPTYSFT